MKIGTLKQLSSTLLFTLLSFSGCNFSLSDDKQTTITGTFVDAPVKGIDYRCTSGSEGSTNSNGEYTCVVGDDVTFSLGTITLGTVAAQTTMITPYTLFPNDLTAALNVARLLQSLDLDANASNALIDLNSSAISLLPSTTDFSATTFETDVQTALSITLITQTQAKQTMDSVITSLGGSIPVVNIAPVSNAGVDQNVLTTSTVTLNGSASSDANNDPLTYSWSITSKPTGSGATLSSSTVVSPTLTADVDGSYVFALIVNDGTVNSVADSVTVTSTTGNMAPVANAGVDQNVTTGSFVTLNGSASSDANSDPLTYSWSISTKPTLSIATLSSTSSATPTFTADLDGLYAFKLIVNDSKVDGDADHINVYASTVNIAPVANAGIDQNVTTRLLVTLDGSASSDANSDPIYYTWSITSKPLGSSVTLSNITLEKPTFTADVDGTYVFRLAISDTKSTTFDSITVTATTPNVAPVANAGIDQNVLTTGTVTLNGSASSDANGDTLTYSWSIISKPSGSSATLSSTTVVSPTFTADVDGTYVFALVVNDGKVNSGADSITVTSTTANATPIANAGVDQTVPTTSTVTLSASGSSDANSDPLTYSWSITSKPVTSTTTLSSSTAVSPTFTADVNGDYVFSLVVNDGTISSVADAITVTASTAQGFTMVALDVNESSKSGNWKTLSSTTLFTTPTASVNAQGSYGTFSVVGDTLTYTKTAETNASDSGIIDIISNGVTQHMTVTVPCLYWKQLAGGGDLTTAIKSDGTIWSWGNINYLGAGSVANTLRPMQESSKSTDWIAIAAGVGHTLALKSDGTLWAWGRNTEGELGDGTTVSKLVPTQESTKASDWASVGAGDYHSLAIKTNGTLWAWGNNLRGQLGDNTTIDKLTPTQEATAATNWKSATGAYYHSIALKTDGTLWAWGSNSFGQLGDATTVNKLVPTQEATAATNWKSVSAGVNTSIALKSDGTFWAWGWNSKGQFGANTLTSISTPTQTLSTSTWVNADLGGDQVIAVQSDGTLWAWGGNASGEVGDGTKVNVWVPTQESSLSTNWYSVGSGIAHSSAIKKDGTLWTWGIGGKIGDGTITERLSPVSPIVRH